MRIGAMAPTARGVKGQRRQSTSVHAPTFFAMDGNWKSRTEAVAKCCRRDASGWRHITLSFRPHGGCSRSYVPARGWRDP